MKKILYTLFFLFCFINTFAQNAFVRGDSIFLTNRTKSSVIVLQNATKDSTGAFAKNMGHGVVNFKKILISDIKGLGDSLGKKIYFSENFIRVDSVIDLSDTVHKNTWYFKSATTTQKLRQYTSNPSYFTDFITNANSLDAFEIRSNGTTIFKSAGEGVQFIQVGGLATRQVNLYGGIVDTGGYISNSGIGNGLLLNQKYTPTADNDTLFGAKINNRRVTNDGNIASIGTITGGSGYTNGTGTITLSKVSGTGSGINATANYVVSGGAVTSITIVDKGASYNTGDVLTGAVPGGTGFSFPVASTGSYSGVVYEPLQVKGLPAITGGTSLVVDAGGNVGTGSGGGGSTNADSLGHQPPSYYYAASNPSGFISTISGITAGGELAGTYPNPTLLNSSVIGKVLTGYTSGAGTVAATDNILQAIQKLNGNITAIPTYTASNGVVKTGSNFTSDTTFNRTTANSPTLAQLQTTFNTKQATLVSGTNIKTVNSNSLLGSGNVAVGDALVANPLSQFAATTSAQLRGVLSDETGTGSAYFQGGALGTPSGGTATNLTGLPLTTGVTGILPIANGGTGTTTPGIVAGTNVTVTGTWPNQTVNSTSGGGTWGSITGTLSSQTDLQSALDKKQTAAPWITQQQVFNSGTTSMVTSVTTGTFTYSTSGLVITGGDGSFSNKSELPGYSLLEDYQINIGSFQNTTNGTGLAIGIDCGSTEFAIAKIDLSAGANRGKILITRDKSTYPYTSAALTFANTDNLQFVLVRTKFAVQAYFLNLTTGLQVQIGFDISSTALVNGTGANINRTGRPCIFALGGTQTFGSTGSITYSTAATKNPKLSIVGNSIEVGYAGANLAGRWSSLQYQNKFPMCVLAMASATSGDIVNALPEILLVHPEYVSLTIGVNDAITSVSPTTTNANLLNINNTLIAAGIKVIWCSVLPTDGAFSSYNGAILTMNGYISGLTGYTKYVDFNTNVPITTVDGIHPNSSSHGALATYFIAQTGGIFEYNTIGATGVFPNDITVNGITVGIGNNALATNTVVGYQAGSVIAAGGLYNTGMGYQSLKANTTGQQNSALGYFTLKANTTGQLNTALGMYSMQTNTTGSGNTALGYFSLASNVSTSNLTALGYASLSSNTSGTFNTGLGFSTLTSNTTGTNNTAAGYNSLITVTDGTRNTGFGDNTLKLILHGGSNTAIGSGVLQTATSSNNTAGGVFTLQATTTGGNNTGFGYLDLFDNTTGAGNTSLGYQAGYNGGVALTTLANCTFLGINANSSTNALSNSTALGNGAQITASNQMVYGNTSVTSNVFNGTLNITGLTASQGVVTDASKNLVSASISTISSSNDITAQTAAGNITSVTSAAANSTYDVGGYINVTAIATDVIQAQITYTDENNTAQTLSLASISAIGNNSIGVQTIRVKASTTITLKTNLTTGIGTITFDAGGYIKKDY